MMKDYFEWSDSYSVGVKELDDQHMQILALANNVIQAVEENKDRAEIIDIFSKIKALTTKHFHKEEELMRNTGFPDLEGHTKEHEVLMEQAKQYSRHLELGEINGSIFAMFLVGWVLIHIKKEDKKYTTHLNAHGIF